MRVRRFNSVLGFRDHALPLLLQHEAESCVILGMISRFIDPALKRPDEPLPFLAAVEGEDARAAAAAAITGRYPIVVTPGPVAAWGALAEHLADSGTSPIGVVGSAASSEAFATAWSRRTGCVARPDINLGLYQTECVIPPFTATGSFRQARSEDVPLLTSFAASFFRDVNEPAGEAQNAVERAMADRRLFVWCDAGKVVSMAAWAGPTPNGVRVNFVYTPPEFRGRGYASNCVAALTDRLLKSGRRFVFLFTDLGNPISNRIYQSIGYRHLADHRKFMFD